MLEVGAELDALERHRVGEQHVHELAVGRSGAQLLYLAEATGQAVVHPGQHVVSGQVLRRHVRRVHVHRHRTTTHHNLNNLTIHAERTVTYKMCVAKKKQLSKSLPTTSPMTINN